MFGSGIVKGLVVTFKRTFDTFADDFSKTPARYQDAVETDEGKMLQQPTDMHGIFTIQYPEEKRVLPERFRYIPMLVFDEETNEQRCTACGICSKVCPPQCIWIVREQNKEGKPVPNPAEFYIDASICMSCGLCAEYCPFDSIKMNHDYELASYDRHSDMIYDLKKLSVPTSYYKKLYPEAWEAELKAKAEKEAKKKERAAAAAARKAAAAAKKAAAAKAAE